MATNKYSKIAAKTNAKVEGAKAEIKKLRAAAVFEILKDAEHEDVVVVCARVLGMAVAGCGADVRDAWMEFIREQITDTIEDIDEMNFGSCAQDEREATGATTH